MRIVSVRIMVFPEWLPFLPRKMKWFFLSLFCQNNDDKDDETYDQTYWEHVDDEIQEPFHKIQEQIL